MGFAIHPISWEKRQTHDHYPQTRQPGQEPDCLFCLNANACKKRMGIFFVGEKYKPCENHEDKVEKSIKAAREIEKEKAKQEAVKYILTPTPRPDGARKDCLYCRKLHRYKCRNRLSNYWPRQGKGEICENYADINIRPTEAAPHCDYCLIQHYCDPWTKEHRGPCGKYEEYAPDNSGQKG